MEVRRVSVGVFSGLLSLRFLCVFAPLRQNGWLFKRFLAFGGALLLVALAAGACRPTPGKPALPPSAGQPSLESVGAPVTPLAQVTPLSVPDSPAGTPYLIPEPAPDSIRFPTLVDLWEDRAHFAVDVDDTGLPMGESDTLVMSNGALWSYVHASDRSASVRDQCGDPVAFPGCVVIYESGDNGLTFILPDPPTCLIECNQCPC